MKVQRPAATLLELLVVLALIAILIGLLLPAIQQVREGAARARSQHAVRQLILATHSYAAQYGDRLPASVTDNAYSNGGAGFHVDLLPFLDGGAAYLDAVLTNPWTLPSRYNFPHFVSHADPSLHAELMGDKYCSYPVNAQVFHSRPRLPQTFVDGASNTIAMAEHYASCSGAAYNYWISLCTGSASFRRATFADGGTIPNHAMLDDVYPVTTGSPPRTGSSVPGVTFQARPALGSCDPRIPQSPHTSMIVALADGSTRFVAPGIANSSFWSAITPAGGEVAGLD